MPPITPIVNPITPIHRLHRCILHIHASGYIIRIQLFGADDVPTCFTSILQLLKVSVMPAGLYGCEVWGLLSMQGWSKQHGFQSLDALYCLSDPLEKTRAAIMRRWLHLPKGTPLICLLHELGLEPLVHIYIRGAVRLWNCLTVMDGASPYRDALKQNVTDGLTSRLRNFSCALYMVLRFIMQHSGEGIRLLVSKMMDLQCIDEEWVDRAISATYSKYIAELAGVQNGAGSIKGYYFREVGTHELGEMPCWYNFTTPHGCLLRVLRFRLGQHHLSINTARRFIPKPPKGQRTCRRCSNPHNAVDNEDHCIAACSCPALNSFRNDVLRDIRALLPRFTITSFGDLCAVIERLHAHGHHKLKHDCVLFMVRCFKEAYKCFKSPHTFVRAEPEASDSVMQMGIRDHLDDFDSEATVCASDLADVDADEDASELEEIQSSSPLRSA